MILGIGTIIFFAGPKNNSVGNKKQTSWEEEISRLKTQLNSVKNELKNLSDNTQKSQLESKLNDIENKVKNLSQQDKSTIQQLEREIKEIKKKIESNRPDKSPDPSDTPNNPPSPEQPNDKYPALIATKKELEYKVNPPLAISSVGTGKNGWIIKKDGELPAGSALLTDTLDGSGNGTSQLNNKGITHIIHACPKPRSNFANDQDFINCVAKSVQNSIILADRNNFEKLAIPLVGGGIYLGSCDPQKLAEGIIRGAINQLTECQNLQKIIFLDWHNSKTPRKNRQVFLSAFGKLEDEGWFGKHLGNCEVELAKSPTKIVASDWGDIRDKEMIHRASVIVNAANTQVKFGGGISGAIAEQVGDKTKIEQKAQELINKFNL